MPRRRRLNAKRWRLLIPSYVGVSAVNGWLALTVDPDVGCWSTLTSLGGWLGLVLANADAIGGGEAAG
jgi:hypothetical protein